MNTNSDLGAVAPLEQVLVPPPVGAGVPMTAAASPAELFGGHPIASIGKRIGAALLDSALYMVTLGIGWLIWAAMITGEGYTPGKRLLGMRVRRVDNGAPASFGVMLFMRGIVGGIVASFAYLFTLGSMPLWDKRNQSVYDKVSSTVVVSEG